MAQEFDFETRCIHGNPDGIKDANGSISFPIYQTASFSHYKPGHNESGFDYTRESNPTRSRLEEVVASLEGAAGTIAFTSGMAAISTCFELFHPGDHIICSEDLYGGVPRLHNLISGKNGMTVSYLDTSDIEGLRRAIRPETKAIYLETPTNPTMKITDVRKAAELAGANDLLLIVDNTYLSPYFQNPLELGADIVIHSGTKFLAGHNDTISGFICAKDPALAEELRLLSKTIGGTLAPFDSWLVMRGIKTLAVRMERQQRTAIDIANWLKEQSWVTQVLYPGLPEHPGRAIHMSQARGFGSMVSFHVESEALALKLLGGVRLITFAESLGGVESLLTYPVTQTHPDVSDELKKRLGIDGTLLRLSVGLENVRDLIEDLGQAIER